MSQVPVFRVYFTVRGGHVHSRVFVASSTGSTGGNCGAIVLGCGPEFHAFYSAFVAEFIPEHCSLRDACELQPKVPGTHIPKE